MSISKTDYVLWRECPKNAWLRLHKPAVYYAAELTEFELSVIDAGIEVEGVARRLFNDGVLVAGSKTEAQQKTAELLAILLRTGTSGRPVLDLADFLLTQSLVEEWESRHGRIPSRAWVLIRTDWSKRPGESFLNFSSDGSHTPGFHPECVPFLARERDILGVGVETVGTDAGQAHTFNPMFPCHTIMHGANRFGLASLTNLDQLPPTGAVVIAPPLKIVNGSGSPLRVLALVPA